MAESEDRTEAPSKLRRQQARERGQVAHSPELTGAVALFTASLMMGVCGQPLIAGLLVLIRDPWKNELSITLDLASAVDHFREAAITVLGPLAMILLALVAAGILAHQAQVGGLWSPSLCAPNLGRLWNGGPGRGLATRAGRGAWILGKTAVVLIVAIWAVRSRFDGLAGVGRLEMTALASAWAGALRGLLQTMAIAAMLLGLIDYVIQRIRFDGMLRLTPDEAREDRKATDGDPGVRGRRRRMAKAMRGDAPELLVGATLVVTGANHLIVILGGGPPPRRVSVRSAANGPTGATLRRSAESSQIARVEKPDLAIKLAQSSNQPNQAVSPELLASLAAIWPT